SGTAGFHHQNRRWNADNDPLGARDGRELGSRGVVGGTDSGRSRVVLCLVFLSPSQQSDLPHPDPIQQPPSLASRVASVRQSTPSRGWTTAARGCSSTTRPTRRQDGWSATVLSLSPATTRTSTSRLPTSSPCKQT